MTTKSGGDVVRQMLTATAGMGNGTVCQGRCGPRRSGNTTCGDRLTRVMETSPPRRDRLSGQEITTACRTRACLSHRAIADRLDLTARTVEHHLTGVYHKLGISSRGHLAFALA